MAPKKTLAQVEVEELPPVALTENGSEIPNPTPVEIPAGFKVPESLDERLQRMMRHSLSEWASRNEAETFDEADDFDIADDDDPASPYETHFDPVLGHDLSQAEFAARESHYRKKYAEQTKAYWDRLDRLDALRNGPKPTPPKSKGHRPSDDDARRRDRGEEVKGAQRPSEAGPQDP